MSFQFQCIKSFLDVNIENKTLVICDIDDTLLKSHKNLNHFYQIIKSDFSDLSYGEILKNAWDMMQVYNQIFGFTHTDLYGFSNLLEKIKQTNSKIIFLTARTENSEEYTCKNFQDIGLDYHNFTTYYTNNEKIKGQYIIDHIDTSEYDAVIFIDDNDLQLESVIIKCPKINCYKFEIDGYKEIDF